MKIDIEALELALARKSMLKKDIPEKTGNKVSKSTIHKACKGESISTRSVGVIAMALGVDAADLIKRKDY